MMRTAIRLAIAMGLAAAGTTAALGQTVPGGTGSPTPGTGDSTKITAANREANADYNRLIGASDSKATRSDDRPATHKPAVAATAADIHAGAALRDVKGIPIGTIASMETDGVVVDTGQTKIKVPLMAFGKDDQGILLGITAARFNELVAKAKSAN